MIVLATWLVIRVPAAAVVLIEYLFDNSVHVCTCILIISTPNPSTIPARYPPTHPLSPLRFSPLVNNPLCLISTAC